MNMRPSNSAHTLNELRLQFEAMRGFSDEEKHIAKTLLESLILKHDASRFQSQSGR